MQNGKDPPTRKKENENWQGEPKYSKKTCRSASLFTINPTWHGLGSNPGRRGGKLATNDLSYGTALPPLPVTWNIKLILHNI
jgi:hypothetical protein